MSALTYVCKLQFVLDMQFVIQLASSGKCASRVLRLMVPELTSRAVSAFAATGADLNRLASSTPSIHDILGIKLLPFGPPSDRCNSIPTTSSLNAHTNRPGPN